MEQPTRWTYETFRKIESSQMIGVAPVQDSAMSSFQATFVSVFQAFRSSGRIPDELLDDLQEATEDVVETLKAMEPHGCTLGPVLTSEEFKALLEKMKQEATDATS